MNKVYVVYGSSFFEKPTALCVFEDKETADEYARLAEIACGCYPYKVTGSDVSLNGYLSFHVEPMELFREGYKRMDIQREVTLEFTGENLITQRKKIIVGGSTMDEDIKEFTEKFIDEQFLKYDSEYNHTGIIIHEKGY